MTQNLTKTVLLALAILLSNTAIQAQNVNIPDANFKAYLVGNTAINTNSDTEIQVSEATAFTGAINCPSLGITDLTGIEAFTALTQLQCNNNQITALDLSNNTALTNLRCFSNQLTVLDLSNNTALTQLNCSYNQLTALDLSNNAALTGLYCNNNLLTALDLSNNTALTNLYCSTNQLTALDLSNNTALTQLGCFSNQLTALNLSNNTALTDELDCSDNQLTDLNVKNGNNSNLTYFIASNNPALTCIQVDDAAYSTTNWIGTYYAFDAASSFSEDCSLSTGINNHLLENSINVYPNPATSQLNIQTQEPITNKEIIDLSGRVVYIENDDKTTVQIAHLPTGIYFIKLSTENGVYQQKFVKN